MTQGWAAMGKPDFATCGKLFYRLPAELREGMNRSEERVLIWTIFLTWTASFRSGRATTVASFCETWLGARFGKSRWTVLRALKRLEGFNFVKRIRRSPKKDGTFQTNLIALTARLTNIFGTTTAQPRGKTPCSKTAPQEVKNGYKGEKTAPSSGFADHSLSLSAAQLRERNDRIPKEPEEQEDILDENDPRRKAFSALFERFKASRLGRAPGL